MSTISDQIFAHVMRDILSGNLRPHDRLAERDLVTRFGTSRTPVREAIKRLFERGFLTSGPKGVGIVRDMTRDEVEDLYALRLLLEGTAARLTVGNITSDEIARLEEINRQFEKAVAERDLSKMLDVKAEFHSTAVRAARNRWLAEVLVALREKAYAVRYASWHDIGHVRQTIEAHEQMIDALRRRDTRRYRKLVLDHVRLPLQMYRERVLAWPVPGSVGTRGAEKRKTVIGGLRGARRKG